MNVKAIVASAKHYYFNLWRGHEKISPAFGEKVHITRLGWNHICYSPRRLLKDKIIRLKKLPLARALIETATTYQTVRKVGIFTQYGFRAIKGDTVIKVVVSQKDGSYKKLLYSVMFKSLKHHRQYLIGKNNNRKIRKFIKENPKSSYIRRRK